MAFIGTILAKTWWNWAAQSQKVIWTMGLEISFQTARGELLLLLISSTDGRQKDTIGLALANTSISYFLYVKRRKEVLTRQFSCSTKILVLLSKPSTDCLPMCSCG